MTDNDNCGHSVHSDNSTGSTSTAWRITPTKANNTKEDEVVEPSQQVQQQRVVVSREPFRPESAASSASGTANSSQASTPERGRIKRGGSMEEYEAELDRGRSKKVKKRHHHHHDSENGYDGGHNQPRFNSSGGGQNPFQSHQNRSYQQLQHANSWSNGSSYQSYNQHRDHSYHAGSAAAGGDRRNGGGYYGGGHKRSHSAHQSGGGDHRDHHHHRHHRDERRQSWGGDRFSRQHYNNGNRHSGGGYRGAGGGNKGYNRDYHYNRDYNRSR